MPDGMREEHMQTFPGKNIVVGIYQCPEEDSDKSRINGVLETLQRKWREEKGEKSLAFVFGDGVTYARDFSDTRRDVTYYVENSRKEVELSHIWFLGMALLEKKYETDKRRGLRAENYFYLITNRGFKKVDTDKILSALRFENLEVTPVLIKSGNGAGGRLEKYIEKKGSVYVDTKILEEEQLKDYCIPI